jgi:hypothetical protein
MKTSIVTAAGLAAGVLAVAAAGLEGPSGAAPTLKVEVAGRKLTLPVPAGMCPFDEAQAWDKQDLEGQRRLGAGKNLILGGFAACDQLQAIRQARLPYLGAYGYIKSSLPLAGGQPLDGVPREAIVAEITKAAEDSTVLMIGELQEKMEEKLKTVRSTLKTGDVRRLGVAYKRPDMVGLLMVVRLEAGGETLDRYAVTGLTVVRGIPVDISIYRQATDDSVARALIEESQAVVRRVISLNP